MSVLCWFVLEGIARRWGFFGWWGKSWLGVWGYCDDDGMGSVAFFGDGNRRDVCIYIYTTGYDLYEGIYPRYLLLLL